MKPLARAYVWWPGVDQDLERLVQDCTECQNMQASPLVAPLHPWECPWARVYIDYAGPFMGKMFLVLVDTHLMARST